MAKLAIHGGEAVRRNSFPRWPEVDTADERAVNEVVGSGNWWMYVHAADEFAVAGEGRSRIEQFEQEFGKLHHAKHTFATTSGSASLEIACRAIGLEPGDEVITTPYTFVATSTCILNSLAIPVYVDIEPGTYNLNVDLVEQAITERTRAIIPVHFGGVFVDMERLRRIAEKHHLRIIEDAAHSHGASLSGDRWAGTLGDIGIFSLQQSKILTCGEGGVITTNDDRLGEIAWSLRHYGRKPGGKWYEHVRLGWHYRMTEMQGALLVSQLAKLAGQNERRRRNARHLAKLLRAIPGITVAEQHPDTVDDVYYILCLGYDSRAWDGIPKARLVEALNAEGVPVSGGYEYPLYRNPLFENLDMNKTGSPYRTGRSGPIPDYRQYREVCGAAERACTDEALWVPHNLLLGSEEDTNDVARAFEKVYESKNELSGG